MAENSPRTYHLYGRKSYPQPLTFVGELETVVGSDQKKETFERFGADGWVELIAFPASAIVRVLPREEAG